MPFVLRIAPLAGAFLLASLTAASAAPKQLYNKSILISFGVHIPAKGSDGSTPGTRTSSRIVYVSSAGRVFAKATRTAGRNREDKERGPEDSGGGRGLSFSGDRLTGVLPFISGASLLTISFDPGFQSCSGTVVMGRDSGKPLVWKGLNGVTYTSNGPPNISGVSCSIRDGNALAN